MPGRFAAPSSGGLIVLAAVAGIAASAPLATPDGSPPTPDLLPGSSGRWSGSVQEAPGPTYADFVGAGVCGECHREQFDRWSSSTHGSAGGAPSPATVLAPFDGAPIRFADADVFPRVERDGSYSFTVERPDREPLRFVVEGVVGGGHMEGGGTQGFVSRFPDGTVRFLPFDYSRQGETWFCNTAPVAGFWVAGGADPALRPDRGWVPVTTELRLTDCGDWPPVRILGTDDQLGNCQQCHGSRITVAYDTLAGRYDTRIASLGIDCESCHGPGREHVELARSGTLSDEADIRILAPDTLEESASVELCLQCHALKRALDPDYLPGEPLEEHYSLKAALVGDRPFHPDGRVRTFGYQENHLSSSCFVDGTMTCVDCHDPHAGSYRDPRRRPLEGRLDDGQCLGCHESKRADPEGHTNHAAGSPGSVCVNCHMPYLQQPVLGDRIPYARSDHTIPVPRPGADDRMGITNACALCHDDRNVESLARTTAEWYGELKPRPLLVERLIEAERSGARPRRPADLLDGASERPMTGVMAINHLLRTWLRPDMADRDPELVRQLQALAGHDDPDLRAAALAALHLSWSDNLEIRAFLDAALRAASPDDTALRARWSLVLVLAGEGYRGSGNALTAIRSFEKALEVSPADPDILLNLATAYSLVGEYDRAIRYYVRSLQLDPSRAVAYVNLGLTLEILDRGEEAEAAYRRATEVRPGEALAHMNLGNIHLRRGELDAAIDEYRAAVAADPGLARANYYLAVTYVNTNRLEQARRALLDARDFAPGDPEILELLRRVDEALRRPAGGEAPPSAGGSPFITSPARSSGAPGAAGDPGG